MSARTFSRAIGVPDNNTQNYLGPKAALPKADYLERVVLHFQSINPWWLLTGIGPAFVEESPELAAIHQTQKKISKSMVVGHVGGNAIQNQGISGNEQALQREVELLRSQIVAQERTIKAQERTIQLLDRRDNS